MSQPWLEYLEDEIEDFEKGSVDEQATIIIRNILAANTTDEATEKEAALQLEKHARSVHLRSDPMVRCLPRVDRYIHANNFQETMVHAARLIPYDSDLQDRLIHLLLGIFEAEVRAL